MIKTWGGDWGVPPFKETPISNPTKNNLHSLDSLVICSGSRIKMHKSALLQLSAPLFEIRLSKISWIFLHKKHKHYQILNHHHASPESPSQILKALRLSCFSFGSANQQTAWVQHWKLYQGVWHGCSFVELWPPVFNGVKPGSLNRW